MSWTQMNIQQQWEDLNGDPLSGGVLKAYTPGTTTNISIAIDKDGSSPQATITLNAEGKYEVSGNEIIPFIDRDFKWAIFSNASDATANSNPFAGFYDDIPRTAAVGTIKFDLVSDMVASVTLLVGDIVQTLGYIAKGDGGDMLYEVVQALTGTADGGSFINLATLQAKALFPSGVVSVDHFGATDSGGVSAEIQNALDYLRDNGGELLGGEARTYTCDLAITLLSESVTVDSWVFSGRGCIFNFSASGITSGPLFHLGATSQNNAHDKEFVKVHDFSIVGSEGAISAPPTAPNGSTIGLFLEFALNITISNINIKQCFNDLKTKFVFALRADSIRCRESYIAYRMDDNSTLALWTGCEATNSRYAVLIQPTDSTLVLSNQTFINFRSENNRSGPFLDPLDGAGVGIVSCCFINPYFESMDFSHNTHGKAFVLATPDVIGADRTRDVYGCNILDGLWSQTGAWGANDPPLVVSTTGTVKGATYRIPALFSQIIGVPNKFRWSTLIDKFIGGSLDYEELNSSKGVTAFAGATGTTSIKSGNVASVTRTGTGVYEINYTEGYDNGPIITGSCTSGTVIFISHPSGTQSVVNTLDLSDPPVLFDPTLVSIHVEGVIT